MLQQKERDIFLFEISFQKFLNNNEMRCFMITSLWHNIDDYVCEFQYNQWTVHI